MMKKLVMLALVMGIASLASAGLVINGNQLHITGEASNSNVMLLASAPALAGFEPVLTADGTGNLSYVAAYGVMDSADLGLALGMVDVYEINVASSTAGVIKAGVQAAATYSVLGFGAVDMGLGSVTLVDSNTMAVLGQAFVVPEPATMVLLGLGALVLRRKK